MGTLEVRHARIRVRSPWDTYPDGIGRGKLSPALAAAEALSLIGGVQVPGLLCRIAPFYSNFVNEVGILDGAYGPRIYRQMLAIESRIKRDPATRQGVAVIWRDYDAARFTTNDLPCTVNLHFGLRNDRLEMHTTMRSNDVWLGVPYDIFQFTQLQVALANALDVGVGVYVHDSHSLHIYDRNLEVAAGLHEPSWNQGPVLPGIVSPSQPFWRAAVRASIWPQGQGSPVPGEVVCRGAV
jgi:thymidylate synthase